MAIVAHRTALVTRQIKVIALGDENLAARSGDAKIVDSPPIFFRQRCVGSRADLLGPRPIGVEHINAQKLDDLTLNAFGHLPVGRDVEGVFALVFVRPSLQADAEELPPLVASLPPAQPVRGHYPELKKRVALPCGDKAQYYAVGDHRTTEVNFQKPILQRTGALRLPVGSGIAVQNKRGTVPTGAHRVDATLKRVLRDEWIDVGKLGRGSRHFYHPGQKARLNRAVGAHHLHPGRCVPSPPMHGPIDAYLVG